jgi:Do/DeqQ family serine protease
MQFFQKLWFCFFALAALPAIAQDAVVPVSQAQLYYSFSPIVKQAAPAVVNIYTRKKVTNMSPLFADPFFQQFFGGQLGMPQTRLESSLGSGVMVAASGQVITSYHVVDGADDIMVVLGDRREYKAKIIRKDPQADLALLQLDAKGKSFTFLGLRDSDSLQVGDLVLALGNPFGVGQTVTSGIISALGRPVETANMRQYFIQTDAAINPGNSGGALVDMQGKLVGINTAIFSKTGGSLGIGFAIPANLVKSFLSRKTTASGRVVKPWFGAQFQPVTREVANAVGLEKPAGALVSDVYRDSPAADAGLLVGDVVIAANGQPLDEVEALRYAINTGAIGSVLKLDVRRKNKTESLALTLSAPPENPPRDTRMLRGKHPLNGVQVSTMNPAVAAELDLPYSATGVVVMNDTQYVRTGDIVLAFNGAKITSTKQLDVMLSQPLQRFAMQLLRSGQVINLMVQ